MNYPQELIDEVKKRSAGMRLEGINSGSGPKHPKLMIIGEAPGRNEMLITFLLVGMQAKN